MTNKMKGNAEAVARYRETEKYQKANWKAHLRRRYGISPERYSEMLAEQYFCCAICQSPEEEQTRRFSVDHNHTTGQIRGLLCHRCNAGLGLFLEKEDLLASAISYLREHSLD